MRDRLRLPALLLGAGLAAACTEPLRPDDVLGTYTLHAVAGEALPAVVDSSGSLIVRVLADTLRMAVEGRGRRVRIVQSEYPTGGAPTDTVRWDVPLNYWVVERRIEMYICPWDADCFVPNVIARTTADGLRVVFALGQRVPQDYVRLTSAP
jgi:hypothetical protein